MATTTTRSANVLLRLLRAPDSTLVHSWINPGARSRGVVWVEGTCDWELNRRAGLDYELLPPEAAIYPSEDKVSIEATYAMRASFAGGEFAGALKFLDELVALLTGGEKKH